MPTEKPKAPNKPYAFVRPATEKLIRLLQAHLEAGHPAQAERLLEQHRRIWEHEAVKKSNRERIANAASSAKTRE